MSSTKFLVKTPPGDWFEESAEIEEELWRAFRTTTDIDEAMHSFGFGRGYIGETWVYPRWLADDIHTILTGRPLPRWYMYYYGTPNDYLKELFDLSE